MSIFNKERQTDNRYKIIPIDKLGEEQENKKNIRLTSQTDQRDPAENYRSHNDRLPTPDLLCPACSSRLTEIHKRLIIRHRECAGLPWGPNMSAAGLMPRPLNSYINDGGSLM